MTDYKTQARLKAEELSRSWGSHLYKSPIPIIAWHDVQKDVEQALQLAFEEGKQSVLARWPSEDEIRQYVEARAELVYRAGFTLALLWLRERLGV